MKQDQDNSEAKQETAAAAEEELFKVEKIVDSKLDKNGARLYKTRWKGYTAADDTWEPAENVASTGHVDRYERQLRQRTLREGSAGVAILEYEDGERETVDLNIEEFRDYSSDDERNDNGTEMDLSEVKRGAWIEILWPHTNMYFPCKVISWIPHRSINSMNRCDGTEVGGMEDSNVRSGVQRDKNQPARKRRGDHGKPLENINSKQKKARSSPQRTQDRRLDDKDDHYEGRTRGRRLPEFTAALAKRAQAELAPGESTHTSRGNETHNNSQENGLSGVDNESIASVDSSNLSEDAESHSDRSVEMIGHGIPLFDEPEDDLESSSDGESDSDGEGDDDDDDGSGFYGRRPPAVPKLTFEEQWKLKLKRTQEIIDEANARNELQQSDH